MNIARDDSDEINLPAPKANLKVGKEEFESLKTVLEVSGERIGRDVLINTEELTPSAKTTATSPKLKKQHF